MAAPAPDDATPIPTDDREEVVMVARGIASAVAPEDGLTDVQAALLGAIAEALTGFNVDYHDLDPLTAEEFAEVLAEKPEEYRQRIVHHMVLGELVLKPLPHEVALRVQQYTAALGIQDKFVRIAHRYAQGATGLAWIDLQRSGFTAHLEQADPNQDHYQTAGTPVREAAARPRGGRSCGGRSRTTPTTRSDARSGRCTTRAGSRCPAPPEGASPFLAQHDFVHVLADYGTNLKGELEVFALIGRANPDPQGFAWLATLVGLFETGYVEDTGFFERDVREHNIQAPGMHVRIADAIRRGQGRERAVPTGPVHRELHAPGRPLGRRSARDPHGPPEVGGRARVGFAGCVRSRGHERDTTGVLRPTRGR